MSRDDIKLFEGTFRLLEIDDNTMCCVWACPINWSPARFIVSVGNQRHTHSLLALDKKVRLAIVEPGWEEFVKAEFGRQSGRTVKKPKMDPYISVAYQFTITQLIPFEDHTLVVLTCV